MLAIFALVAILLPARASRVFTALLAVLSLLVWAQGNLFVWDYGLLDGSSIDWTENHTYGFFELTLWSLAIVVVIWKESQIGSTVVGIAMTLAVLQLGLFGYTRWSESSTLERGINLTF